MSDHFRFSWPEVTAEYNRHVALPRVAYNRTVGCSCIVSSNDLRGLARNTTEELMGVT